MQQQKNAFLTDLNTIFENFKENIDILKLFIFIKTFLPPQWAGRKGGFQKKHERV